MSKFLTDVELDQKIRRLSTDSIGRCPDPEDFGIDRKSFPRITEEKNFIDGIAESIVALTLVLFTVGGCAYSGLIDSDYSVVDCLRSTFLSTLIAFVISVTLKAYSKSHYINLDRYQEASNSHEQSYQEFKDNYLLGLKEHWETLDGHQFEQEVAKLFRLAGMSVSSTPRSGDYGVDLVIRSGNKTIICQCKAHKNPVGPAVVRDLYGALHHFNAESAMLISLSGFTKGVYEFVSGKPIELLGLDELIVMYHDVSQDPRFHHRSGHQLDLWGDVK